MISTGSSRRGAVAALCVLVVVAGACTSQAGTASTTTTTQSEPPIGTPLGVPHPSASAVIVRAERKLLAQPGATLRLTVRVSSLGGAAGTGAYSTIAAVGSVDFRHRLARWTASLPGSLGGPTTVIYDGEDVYISSGNVTTGHGGPTWLHLGPSQMGELPRLGFLANLVVLFDPFVEVALQAAARTAKRLPGRASAEAFVLPRAAGRDAAPVQLAGDSGGGCSDKGGEDYGSTLSPSQVATETDTSFQEFSSVMASWQDIIVRANVAGSGDLYSLAFQARANKAGLQLSSGVSFCSAQSTVSTITTPGSAETESQSFINLDPCLVGTWRLTSPIVASIRYGAGPGGTVAGLQGTVLTIDEEGQATLDFTLSEPMTIEDNLQDSPALASAKVRWIGTTKTEVVHAANGYIDWGSEDLLAQSNSILSTTQAEFIGSRVVETTVTQFDPVSPDVLSAPGLEPTQPSGPYSCTSASMNVTLPLGPGGREANFVRVSSLVKAGEDLKKASDALNKAIEALAKDADLSSVTSEVKSLSTELSAFSTELNKVPSLPFNPSCAVLVRFHTTLDGLSRRFAPLNAKLSKIASELKADEDKIKEQAETLADAVIEAKVAAAKAVSESGSYLTADAAGAVDAATQAVSSEVENLKSLFGLQTSAQGLLDSYESLLKSSRKCP